MSFPGYYKKVKNFSFKEKILLFKFSLGSILAGSVSKGLKHSYHFIQKLQARNTVVKKRGEDILFSYSINDHPLTFELKRNSSDTLVFEQIIELEEYRPVVDLIRSSSMKVCSIMDAGANVGLASLYFKQYFPEASIILLEPEKKTFRRLVKNIELNNCSKVIPLNYGLWKEETTLTIDRNFRDKEDWSVRLSAETNGKDRIGTKTILGLMKEYNWDHIDLLKIDVEGAEKELFLEDATINTWLSKIGMIAMEIHDETGSREAIEKILISNGFGITYSNELLLGKNNATHH